MTRQRVSGAQLAERIAQSQSYISKRLRDESPLTANDIEDICNALGEDLGKMLHSAARAVAAVRNGSS
ncbi:helix-turn-helix domain-containing protein [Pseudarthrobacter sp. Y6]|uniref:helix-turn-helix domain-containing protein n=1 Tax=Pseudarthrobacter sp. Y6 TaxID=3418422 RepID=UPI003CF44712